MVDLATALPHKVIGEKLHEVMITADDSNNHVVECIRKRYRNTIILKKRVSRYGGEILFLMVNKRGYRNRPKRSIKCGYSQMEQQLYY